MAINIERAIQLDKIPNCSYLTSTIGERVESIIKTIPGISVTSDYYAVYARYFNGDKNLPEIVIDTHLDHPGFIVKNKNKAQGFGSINNTESVYKVKKDEYFPVNYFYKQETIADGFLGNIDTKNGITTADIQIEYPKKFQVPVNSQVVPKFSANIKDGSILMRSADNLVTAVLCTQLMEWLSQEKIQANATFIFNKNEEVQQVTATGISLRGTTPYGNINENSKIIVLEVGPTKMDNRQGYSNSGVFLINRDRYVDYRNFKGTVSSGLKDAATKSGYVLESAQTVTNTDATAYAMVSRVRDIATLMIQSKNRHNVGSDGILTSEIILEKDFEAMLNILKSFLEDSSINTTNNEKPYSKNSLIEIDVRKRSQLINAFNWARPRLENGHPFPENNREKATFIYKSIINRINKLSR